MMGFATCGPNEAMVVSGCCKSRPVMIPGGSVWVWPYIEQLQRIPLGLMKLQVISLDVCTLEGVAISCIGIAQIKIQGQSQEMLADACMQFLGKSPKQISRIVLETLEGHQRAIMGSMTVEEIIQDRKKFSKLVFQVASTDLVQMGISVVSYTLKDVKDRQGYLAALGKSRTAYVQSVAKIGESKARKTAGVEEAKATQKRLEIRYKKDTEIAKAKRDFNMNKARYDLEVETEKAQSEMAYQLQSAITKQAIKEEEMKIIIEEKRKQVEIEDQEVLRCEKELESKVKKPAEAEKYRLETIASAERKRVILEAEAEAESIRLKGQAEAFAIEVKAKAEATEMAEKAESWKEYKRAAIVDMILSTLPKIAAEVAAPLTKTEKVTIISSGSGGIGATKITGEVIDVIGKLPEMMQKMSGVDISTLTHLK